MMQKNAHWARSQSQTALQEMGFHSVVPLPLIGESYELQSPKAIKMKIIALYCLTGLANGADRDLLHLWIEEHHLKDCFDKGERAYFTRPLVEQEIIDLSWFQEALFLLAWSLSLVDKLPGGGEECNLNVIFPQIPPEKTPEAFLNNNLVLRSRETIHRELDLYYCLHWLTRHPEVHVGIDPNSLNKSAIRERRRTLEWIYNRAAHWREISLNT